MWELANQFTRAVAEWLINGAELGAITLVGYGIFELVSSGISSIKTKIFKA